MVQYVPLLLAELVPRERASVTASVLLEIVGNAEREVDDLGFKLLFVAVPGRRLLPTAPPCRRVRIVFLTAWHCRARSGNLSHEADS